MNDLHEPLPRHASISFGRVRRQCTNSVAGCWRSARGHRSKRSMSGVRRCFAPSRSRSFLCVCLCVLRASLRALGVLGVQFRSRRPRPPQPRQTRGASPAVKMCVGRCSARTRVTVSIRVFRGQHRFPAPVSFLRDLGVLCVLGGAVGFFATIFT